MILCSMSSLTEQEQKTSQRDVNIDVSDVTTAADNGADQGRESRDVTVQPIEILSLT